MPPRPLLAVLQQPELHKLVDDFSASYKLPVFTDTARLGLERGLGGASTAVRTAAFEGAAGYRRAPWAIINRRVVEVHGDWTEAAKQQVRHQVQRRQQFFASQHLELERERQEAAAAANYVSTTP